MATSARRATNRMVTTTAWCSGGLPAIAAFGLAAVAMAACRFSPADMAALCVVDRLSGLIFKPSSRLERAAIDAARRRQFGSSWPARDTLRRVEDRLRRFVVVRGFGGSSGSSGAPNAAVSALQIRRGGGLSKPAKDKCIAGEADHGRNETPEGQQKKANASLQKQITGEMKLLKKLWEENMKLRNFIEKLFVAVSDFGGFSGSAGAPHPAVRALRIRRGRGRNLRTLPALQKENAALKQERTEIHEDLENRCKEKDQLLDCMEKLQSGTPGRASRTHTHIRAERERESTERHYDTTLVTQATHQVPALGLCPTPAGRFPEPPRPPPEGGLAVPGGSSRRHGGNKRMHWLYLP